VSAATNIGSLLALHAQAAPEQVASITPHGQTWRSTTYAELSRSSERIAHALVRAGVASGDRVCVFVRPNETWVALVYALFSIGAAPVLIDPGMGRKAVLACVERIQPRGFVGIPLANALRVAFPRAFKSVRVAITVGGPHIGKGTSLRSLLRRESEVRQTASVQPDDVAAILFTSGSTGPAKGVVYTHAMFAAQVRALREMYSMQPGDVDLACFAPFALFGPALGLTTVLPRIDFSRPGKCRESDIVAAIQVHRVVQSFGSPAIWKRVAPWCAERGLKLTSLRRLMIAGAPVSPSLVDQCLAILPPGGDVHTPYGATEALPVASASGREIARRFKARTLAGEGNCVGRAAPGVECRVIGVTDDAIDAWSDDLAVAAGAPGELVVRGENVTREYAFEPEHTSAAKIRDGASTWHRMGDVVRIDGDGCLWFLGRKSQRVETAQGPLYPVAIENVFDAHKSIHKSALVGVGARGAERPWLIVCPKPGSWPNTSYMRDALRTDILRFARANPLCAPVEGVLFRKSFPVDVRHNAKIDRGALKLWAQERVK
jgi:acyl-CoA synthetase (AMP-forming)/AMP-acid ligase II